jgi:hypothetical protein
MRGATPAAVWLMLRHSARLWRRAAFGKHDNICYTSE